MKIQVAGPGCGRCQTTEANVREAVKQLNLAAEVVHVTDVREYVTLGVRLTPAVIVDGKIISSGRVPAVEEIKQLLTG
jgi:small redox-active disulfide protein 2